MVAWGVGWKQGLTANKHELSFRGEENILKMNQVMVEQSHKFKNSIWNIT